jgi:hypothetical protein
VLIARRDATFSTQIRFQAAGPVTSLAVLPGVAGGSLAVGTRARSAAVYPFASFNLPEPPEPFVIFSDFAQEVCFVGAIGDDALAVSSWDSTAAIYPFDGSAPVVLRHETFAIWGVAATPSGFVTIGGDKTIRLFSPTGQQLLVKHDAHTAAIRAVVYAGGRVVTVSNDGNLKEWDLELNQLRSTVVVSEPIYTLAVLEDGCLVVGSDGSGIIFVADGKVVDVFPTGGEVWAITPLDLGDVAAACSDGLLYVLTRDESRRAFDLIENGYFTSLAIRTLRNPDLDDIDAEDLQDIDKAQRPGVISAAPSLFRSGADTKVAALWVPGYECWVIVARLEGLPKSQDAAGWAWDVTVDVETQGRSFPLFMNKGEGPYLVAKRFVKHNRLPTHIIHEIAQFLIANIQPGTWKPKYTSFEPIFTEVPRIGEIRATQLEVSRWLEAGNAGREVVGQLRGLLQNDDVRTTAPDATELVWVLHRLLPPTAGGLYDTIADVFMQFGDKEVPTLIALNLVRLGADHFKTLDDEAKVAYLRVVMNFACYADSRALVYLVETVAKLVDVPSVEHKTIVLKALDVAANESGDAAVALKPIIGRLNELSGTNEYNTTMLSSLMKAISK